MKLQVLVAAMNQTDHSLPDKMNISTDVIVGNQCGFDSIERFEKCGHSVTYLNFAERGVGLNRNNALMRATGDICLFADDDMVYCDDYEKIVLKAFKTYRDADVIVFNLREKTPTRHIITRPGRVGRLNYLRYGTARIAFRLESIRKNGIFFNQCFGGGTPHCHGEDSLFLTACLDRGLVIRAVPDYIAELTEERPSSWLTGYDEKYLRDQGALYRAVSRRFWPLLCLQDALRHSRAYGTSPFDAYRLMAAGAKSFTCSSTRQQGEKDA